MAKKKAKGNKPEAGRGPLASLMKLVKERPADIAMLILLVLFLSFVILKYHAII